MSVCSGVLVLCVGLVRERSASVAATSLWVTSTTRRRQWRQLMKTVGCTQGTLDSWMRRVSQKEGEDCSTYVLACLNVTQTFCFYKMIVDGNVLFYSKERGIG